MKITIETNERIFLIHWKGWETQDYFCNLSQIPTLLENRGATNFVPTIYHYWNKKFKRLGKKELNGFFMANQIQYKIK
jgi:hypothetical protein